MEHKFVQQLYRLLFALFVAVGLLNISCNQINQKISSTVDTHSYVLRILGTTYNSSVHITESTYTVIKHFTNNIIV